MAKDVNFFGSWTDVPYVDLPQVGGGSARFTDVDDTTATASDVSSTKYFYTAAGVRTKGTGTTGSPSYQAKTVTPSETQQTVTADNTYDALSSVTVKGITASYVGSGVTQRSSTDLTVSGATITAPAGYYASAATKSVASTTRATPTISVNSSGLITATVTQSAGYVTAGTTSTTSQLSTQAGKTVTPSQSAQTAVASGKYTTGTITVAAIPSEYIVPEGSVSITANGTDIDVSQYAYADVAVPVGSEINNQNKTVTPSESKQTITPDSGYTGLGTVTVNAIPTDYIGSEITQRSSTDLTVSGATIIAPAGYYSAAASKSVTAGTAGTPSATKGTVSNHAISVTPKVTNTTGYITGGTKTGTAVTVSASELVSGTLEITANGSKDVTNYATVSVAVPVGTTINNQDKTITPTETEQIIEADSGYTGLGTVTVAAITATYVGSGVAQKSSADLTTSDITGYYRVTAPAGYYASNGVKDIPRYDLIAPTVTIAASTGLITATSSIANGKGGYYAGGQTANKTLQLTTQATKTVTPTKATQTAVSSGTYVIGDIKVGPIPDDYLIPTGTITISSNSTGIDISTYATANVSVAAPTPSLQNKTVTPSETQQTVSAESGYDGLGTVTVAAITPTYVGSEITQRTSSSLTNSGATVTAPAGYYEADAKITIASGTEGVPTATKGTVSNHAISITPKVTNVSGYITGGTKTGTAVTVTAAELVSGTKSITENGTGIDVTQYASVDVNVAGASSQQLLAGTSAPSTSTGSDGDVYITLSGSGTVETYPASYTASDMSSTSNADKCVGVSAEDGSATGNIYSSGSSDTGVVEYSFDLSGIPSTANIESVSCVVKAHEENSSKSTFTLQLYAGSTAKGSATTVSGTSNATYTLDCGSWTRDEVDSLVLHTEYGYYGGLVAGATLTVTYSLDTPAADVTMTVTESGWSISGSNIYQKSGGSWASASNVAFDSTVSH